MKGYSAAEIPGEDFARFFTAEEIAAGKPRQAQEIAAREGKYTEEAVRVRKNGSTSRPAWCSRRCGRRTAGCAVERIRATASDRAIVLHCSGEWVIEADDGRLNQVFDNLLSNAVKYGDPQSPIDVFISEGEDAVEVTVTNRGVGISASELPFLFKSRLGNRVLRPGRAVPVYLQGPCRSARRIDPCGQHAGSEDGDQVVASAARSGVVRARRADRVIRSLRQYARARFGKG